MDVTPVKGPDGKFHLPQKIFESMAKTKIGLKGPLATPIGKGHQSLNLALRKYDIIWVIFAYKKANLRGAA